MTEKLNEIMATLKNKKLKNSREFFNNFKFIADENYESLIIFYLTDKGILKDAKLFTNKEESEVTLNARDILIETFENNTTKILLMHNHPSGSCRPSREDLEATKKIIEISKMIDVKIVDHLVISKNNFCSLKIVMPELKYSNIRIINEIER